ncbi:MULTISPECIES: hypothetical protein [unclassified Streptomyces]|uniref:hypothetical protein n=1 Tax=unclassified Streptomyces TaxID=2593676 RepID=UPI00081D4F57|nr:MULTISPECIES: hypothetical protein [unclassified Streptomyces]MYR95266.1 hypothetical protein [Streptomyces sp. SID4937]SCD86765.1 hypothetical protein GA0115243_1044186 [Streptomyces sp. ScaeMP-e83]
MFKIPDRVADLFDDDAIRVEFQQALLAVSQVQGYEMKYLEDGPFSEAARITYRRLKDFDRTALPEEQRELVACAKALSHRLITSGYAIDKAARADEHAADDWPELLTFVQRKCSARVGLPDHDGWERCYTHIVGRAEAALQAGRASEYRDAGYAVLRHFAYFFSGDVGYERRWYLEVPEAS